jgi:two-component system OmpR family sensor kinase
MEAEVIDLRKICLERVEMIEKNYPDINCRVDIPQNIILNKNRDALIRVLDNIIDNAFKYNRRGGSVDISYGDGKLKISDTGVGIRDTKRAFDRFYKESLIGGMGIGLDIVKKLLKELNIDISIKSIPDVGTTIYLKIN